MIKARHPQTTEAIRGLAEELSQLGYYHSIELPDGSVIPGLQTIPQLQFRIGQYPIPENLTGKRVLDIGAWDGWFSFEMERRGASVLAVDASKQNGFLRAKELLNSEVEYLVRDVCRLDPAAIGYFDIVLFFGVLYHLKHPLLALERVCELTTDMACIESLVMDDPSNVARQVPVMEFYEGTELAGQFDNWVGPNTACLLAFCRTAGFARVELKSVKENRAHVMCYRKWPDIERSGDGPELILVENPWTRDHEFSANRDDYLTVWFKSSETGLDCDNVFIQVGAYGSRPVNVKNIGGFTWQTNCKLPPGLGCGWHDVSVSTRTSAWSTPARIPVDVSRADRQSSGRAISGGIEIARITDGKTYEVNRVQVGIPESSVSAWISGVPAGTAMADVSLRLDGADLPATFISDPDAHGLRQVNAMIPMGTQPDRYLLSVKAGGLESPAVPAQLVIGSR
jgi:tRNA (mo5U34)-methyltransferase